MTSYIVAYPAAPGATFDADYYMATHMPLVHETFGPHGMTGARVLFADQPDAPYVVVTTLEFADGAAFTAATSSPDAAAVFADVANFTTITPVTMRARSA
nr:EthD family reductase [Polymorphobacter sp.]